MNKNTLAIEHIAIKMQCDLKLFGCFIINVNKYQQFEIEYPIMNVDKLFRMGQITRVYLAFVKLAHIYRCKKRKHKPSGQFDLFAFEMCEPPKYPIQLVHNDQLYEFNAVDLLKIVYNAITFTHNLYIPINIKFPKNPFNNISFGIIEIQNIYVQMMEYRNHLNIKQMYVFQQFVKTIYMPVKFLIDTKDLMNEIAIQTYVKTCEENEFNEMLSELLYIYNDMYNPPIFIENDYPISKLRNILQNVLIQYAKYKFLELSYGKLLSLKMLDTIYKKSGYKFGRKRIYVGCHSVSGKNIFYHRKIEYM